MRNLHTGLVALFGGIAITLLFLVFLVSSASSQTSATVGQVLDNFAVPGFSVLVRRDSAEYDDMPADPAKASVFQPGQDCVAAENAATYHSRRGDILVAVFQRVTDATDTLLVFLSQPASDGSRVLIASNFTGGVSACLVVVVPVNTKTAS